jgi:hypothetical protein
VSCTAYGLDQVSFVSGLTSVTVQPLLEPSLRTTSRHGASSLNSFAAEDGAPSLPGGMGSFRKTG